MDCPLLFIVPQSDVQHVQILKHCCVLIRLSAVSLLAAAPQPLAAVGLPVRWLDHYNRSPNGALNAP